jgi:hypothetical protein
MLDTKLNLNSHIDHRMQKAIIAFWQCWRATGRTWGLKLKVVYWIHTSVVRPILNYAALLWWKKASQISVNQKTVRLQRLVCINITGSMHVTSNAALEVIHQLTPLSIYIDGFPLLWTRALCSTVRFNCPERKWVIDAHSKALNTGSHLTAVGNPSHNYCWNWSVLIK